MFINNKYTKWYYNIIEKAKNRNTPSIIENHHIIPKCLKGKNNEINLVKLTPKEHFICHWLLTKMVNEKEQISKMYYVFHFMLLKPKDHVNRRYYPCARVYEIAKKKFFENNPVYSKEVREKISKKRIAAWKNPTNAMINGIEKMRKSKQGKSPWNKNIRILNGYNKWKVKLLNSKEIIIGNLGYWCEKNNVNIYTLKHHLKKNTFPWKNIQYIKKKKNKK